MKLQRVVAGATLAALLGAASLVTASRADAPETGNSQTGVIAAIGCGFAAKVARIVPAVGLSTAIVLCAAMFIDAITDPNPTSGG